MRVEDVQHHALELVNVGAGPAAVVGTDDLGRVDELRAVEAGGQLCVCAVELLQRVGPASEDLGGFDGVGFVAGDVVPVFIDVPGISIYIVRC